MAAMVLAFIAAAPFRHDCKMASLAACMSPQLCSLLAMQIYFNARSGFYGYVNFCGYVFLEFE